MASPRIPHAFGTRVATPPAFTRQCRSPTRAGRRPRKRTPPRSRRHTKARRTTAPTRCLRTTRRRSSTTPSTERSPPPLAKCRPARPWWTTWRLPERARTGPTAPTRRPPGPGWGPSITAPGSHIEPRSIRALGYDSDLEVGVAGGIVSHWSSGSAIPCGRTRRRRTLAPLRVGKRAAGGGGVRLAGSCVCLQQNTRGNQMVRARVGLVVLSTVVAAVACGGTSSPGTTASAGCINASTVASNSLGYTLAAAVLPKLATRPLSTAGDPVLKIGFIGILSGQYKAYGVDEQHGAQLAIDQANAAGGVTYNGTTYTFALYSQDDAADATKGAQGATKLVDDKVVAVIGGPFSTATIAESKIFSDNGITQISPSATNPTYTTQGFKTAFRVVGRDDQQGPADADFMVKTLGCKNVGIMDDKSTYGQGLANAVNTQVPTDGATVVDREHVDATQSDFSAQLTAMKGHNPDVIFFGGYSPQFGPLVSQARRLGIKATFVSGDGSQDAESIKLAGSDAEGLFASNAGPAPALQPGYAAFQTSFKAKFNVDIFQYAPQAFDATNIIIQAVKANGGTKAGILAGVAATNNYQGVAQSYSFTSTGDVKESIFTIYKVESATWKAVKAVTLQVS